MTDEPREAGIALLARATRREPSVKSSSAFDYCRNRLYTGWCVTATVCSYLAITFPHTKSTNRDWNGYQIRWDMNNDILFSRNKQNTDKDRDGWVAVRLIAHLKWDKWSDALSSTRFMSIAGTLSYFRLNEANVFIDQHPFNQSFPWLKAFIPPIQLLQVQRSSARSANDRHIQWSHSSSSNWLRRLPYFFPCDC